jgi:hypothetical protein
MMKRLLKVRPALKVMPLAPAQELETLRRKHRTDLFEFFFGTGEGHKAGSIVVNWPYKNRYIELDGIEGVHRS